MSEEYDVIVAGAGNGGLAAAAYAAKAGLKTLLLERNNTPGGCASSFRRGRFEFESALHELCEFGPADNPGSIRTIFDEIGLDVEMVPVNDCFRVVSPGRAGIRPYDVVMPNGRENFIAKLEEVCPGSTEPAKAFFALCDRADAFIKYMTLCDGNPDRQVLDRDFADFMAVAAMSVDEVYDLVGMPEMARSVLSTYWSYIGVPTDELEFVLFGNLLNEYVNRKAYIPKLRSHGISMAWDARIRELGGRIRYGVSVEKVLVRDGRAYGVIAGGTEYRARKLIMDINPDVVYGRMMDPAAVPARARKLCNARTEGVSAVTVYYGLNKSAEELGIHDYSRFVNMQGSRASFDSMGEFNPRRIGGVMNCMNVPIPDYSPEGTCILWGTTLFRPHAFDGMDAMSYPKIKQGIAYGFAMFYRMTAGIDILPYIEEVEVATPVTFARYLNTPGGAIYGYQGSSWDSMMSRMLARKDEMYIRDLDFCGGSSTWLDGYNSSYHTGRAAALRAVRALGKEGADHE